jgi:hypothetical protein
MTVAVRRRMVHVAVLASGRDRPFETTLIDCIAYYFAYVNKRAKAPPPAMVRQHLLTQRLETTSQIRVLEVFRTVLTNRDRHFAETGEFLSAVRRANELGCAIVLGDFEDMLKRTGPKLMVECASAALSAGVPVIDGRTGRPVDPKEIMATVKFLQRDASARRDSIQIGRKLSNAEHRPRANNQPKAAKGTVMKADRTALLLEPVIQEISDELPPGKNLTPTILARALNERQMLSDRGNAWSRGTADRLLKRVETLRSARAK